MTLAEQATTQRELAHRRSLARKLEYAKDRIFQRNYVHGLYCRITVSREHLLEHSYRILLHYFWGWRIFFELVPSLSRGLEVSVKTK